LHWLVLNCGVVYPWPFPITVSRQTEQLIACNFPSPANPFTHAAITLSEDNCRLRTIIIVWSVSLGDCGINVEQ
jgi:hypothetical protein